MVELRSGGEVALRGVRPGKPVTVPLTIAGTGVGAGLVRVEITGPDGGKVRFDVDPFRKHCLLNGLDDIGLTLEHAGSIDTYETSQRGTQPWLWA